MAGQNLTGSNLKEAIGTIKLAQVFSEHAPGNMLMKAGAENIHGMDNGSSAPAGPAPSTSGPGLL